MVKEGQREGMGELYDVEKDGETARGEGGRSKRAS
jgi:hypothetical protein